MFRRFFIIISFDSFLSCTIYSAEKRPARTPSTSRSSGIYDAAYLEMVKAKHRLQRFQVTFASPEGQAGVLTKDILETNPCGPNEIIVTMGHLDAGLRLPFYCPLDYFQYEVLCLLDPQRAIFQPNDNFYGIVRESARRYKGRVTNHELNKFVPSQRDFYSPTNFVEKY